MNVKSAMRSYHTYLNDTPNKRFFQRFRNRQFRRRTKQLIRMREFDLLPFKPIQIADDIM